MTTHEEYFLTPEEVAALLRVPLATVYCWRTKGLGPPGARVGRHLRYRRDAVLEWAKKGEGKHPLPLAATVKRRE